MGTGRVINPRPKTLRRIYPFTNGEKTSFTDLQSKCEPHAMRGLLTKNNNPAFYSHDNKDFTVKNNCGDYNNIIVVKEIKEGETSVEKRVAHLDGILQDVNTGELFYFIGINDDDQVEDPLDHEVKMHKETRLKKKTIPLEGAIVQYKSEYSGICELILHPDSDTDKYIDLKEFETVVVRYVEVTGVISDAERLPVKPLPSQ